MEQYKNRARRLAKHLQNKHQLDLTHGQSLQAIAAEEGHENWQTLLALQEQKKNLVSTVANLANEIRKLGCAVVVFTPEELGGTDPRNLQDTLIEEGNQTLELLHMEMGSHDRHDEDEPGEEPKDNQTETEFVCPTCKVGWLDTPNQSGTALCPNCNRPVLPETDRTERTFSGTGTISYSAEVRVRATSVEEAMDKLQKGEGWTPLQEVNDHKFEWDGEPPHLK